LDKWDKRFMEMVKVIAGWSSCYQHNRKIGAIIVKNKRMAQVIKKIGRIVLNYIKLFLIPFVFVFIILALLVKGIKILVKKLIQNRE
jgi:hypothetical protein